MADERTSGWLPLQDLSFRGDAFFEEPLKEALTCTGRVDRWTHGFHTYPAGLHPEAARILCSLRPEGALWDPFCGGDTTLVEGLAQGRQVIGGDLSPVALLVSYGRTRVWTDEAISSLRSWARRITRDAQQWQEPPRDGAFESIRTWYEPHVAIELQGLRDGIRRAPPELKEALRFLFSSILIKVSYRKSDTNASRDPHSRPKGTTAVLFHKKAREYGRRLEALAQAVPEGTPEPLLALASATREHPPEPAGLVVTSPPYPAVYDYLPLQRLRTAWLGFDDRPLRELEISPRRSFRGDPQPALDRWNRQLIRSLEHVREGLRKEGLAFIVIGDGAVNRKLIDSKKPVLDAAQAAGLEVLAHVSGAREDRGTGVWRREHIIALERM